MRLGDGDADLEIARLLIEHGADVNATNNVTIPCMLFQAVVSVAEVLAVVFY